MEAMYKVINSQVRRVVGDVQKATVESETVKVGA